MTARRLFAASIAALIALAFALPALGHGDGSPDECKTPHSTTGDPVATYTAPAGWTITGVCIKAGQLHTAPLGNGTHRDGCYLVEGVGTNSVTVTRLLGGSGCQEISHVDVVKVPPSTTTEPEDTTTTVADTTTTTTPPSTVPDTSSTTTTPTAPPTTAAPTTTAPTTTSTSQPEICAANDEDCDPATTTTTSPPTAQAETTTTAANPDSTLPRTGLDLDGLPWLAVAALMVGGGLVRLTKGQES